ncbi:MAG: transposase [bacterium]
MLNPSGNLVMQSWGELAARFPEVGSDVIVIMPDHFHGILWITAIDGIEPHSLGQIVRALKGATTHAIRRQIDPGFGWQSNYHDRILRTDGELEQARNYIRRNPSDLLAHPDDPYRLLFGTDDTAPDM